MITALVAQILSKFMQYRMCLRLLFKRKLTRCFLIWQFSAIKIGMLNNREVIDVIATALDRLLIKHVVFDPDDGCKKMVLP